MFRPNQATGVPHLGHDERLAGQLNVHLIWHIRDSKRKGVFDHEQHMLTQYKVPNSLKILHVVKLSASENDEARVGDHSNGRHDLQDCVPRSNVLSTWINLSNG